MFSGYQNIQCLHGCSWLCFYLMSVGLQHIRRRGEFDTTEFFSLFHSTYRKRFRLVRVICGGNCKKLILHRGIVSLLLKHNITILLLFLMLYCACAYEKRAFKSHWKVWESELRWIGSGGDGGGRGGSRIANSDGVVVGVNGNIFPFNESPGAYSVTGTGRDVIPAERVRRGTGTRSAARGGLHFHRRGHRHHHRRHRQRRSPARVYRLLDALARGAHAEGAQSVFPRRSDGCAFFARGCRASSSAVIVFAVAPHS